MIVTSANSLIEPQTGDSGGVEKNISPDPNYDANRARGGKQPRQNNQPRRDKRDVHGWIALDKPIGMTSTHAVAVVKRLFQAKRAGHARTLDPLASRGLPIALREATKTLPFVIYSRKRYRLIVSRRPDPPPPDTHVRLTQTSH